LNFGANIAILASKFAKGDRGPRYIFSSAFSIRVCYICRGTRPSVSILMRSVGTVSVAHDRTADPLNHPNLGILVFGTSSEHRSDSALLRMMWPRTHICPLKKSNGAQAPKVRLSCMDEAFGAYLKNVSEIFENSKNTKKKKFDGQFYDDFCCDAVHATHFSNLFLQEPHVVIARHDGAQTPEPQGPSDTDAKAPTSAQSPTSTHLINVTLPLP
jgi:hypothetical protein